MYAEVKKLKAAFETAAAAGGAALRAEARGLDEAQASRLLTVWLESLPAG